MNVYEIEVSKTNGNTVYNVLGKSVVDAVENFERHVKKNYVYFNDIVRVEKHVKVDVAFTTPSKKRK